MFPALMAYKAAREKKTVDSSRDGIGTEVLAVLLSLGAGAGLFFGVRHLARKGLHNRQQKGALQEGNPAAYATQLKMAFENDNSFGWGTDEEAVFRVLEEIPTKALMQKVQRAYYQLYARQLAADLQDELATTEYLTAMQLINAKS